VIVLGAGSGRPAVRTRDGRGHAPLNADSATLQVANTAGFQKNNRPDTARILKNIGRALGGRRCVPGPPRPNNKIILLFGSRPPSQKKMWPGSVNAGVVRGHRGRDGNPFFGGALGGCAVTATATPGDDDADKAAAQAL